MTNLNQRMKKLEILKKSLKIFTHHSDVCFLDCFGLNNSGSTCFEVLMGLGMSNVVTAVLKLCSSVEYVAIPKGARL
ncbi:CLUMA_CG001705, isoform A [Clunio marinus]|uniref:CLUMA_CG001705, isoform A n=1 Tax=Clunio marinus TaxID=568069 RepID=A0A1J1HIQ2_9DIPT|nr:CLUMA_CG001705, isoform A [Clunio marinus]